MILSSYLEWVQKHVIICNILERTEIVPILLEGCNISQEFDSASF